MNIETFIPHTAVQASNRPRQASCRLKPGLPIISPPEYVLSVHQAVVPAGNRLKAAQPRIKRSSPHLNDA